MKYEEKLLDYLDNEQPLRDKKRIAKDLGCALSTVERLIRKLRKEKKIDTMRVRAKAFLTVTYKTYVGLK